MGKPLLLIINGLPASGKTSLARRLSTDLKLPAFARDSIYETLYDALAYPQNEIPAQLGSAAFALLYHVLGSVLGVGQSVIVEGFFGRPELRTTEFLKLQQVHNFEPFQIMCVADGNVLIKRVIERAKSDARHFGHQDEAWLAQNKELLLQGRIPPLKLSGELIEIDTTNPEQMDYAGLLHRIRA